MISKKLCIASFMFLLISGVGFSQTSNIREIQYLSGTDNENTVEWDFFCTGGRNSGYWTTIQVPSCWEQQGFGTFEQYKTGLPIMRALVLENQNDRNTYSVDDQYMFGESLMICPVTVKGAQTRIVYLPEGTWFDYWTGKAYAGRKYYNIVTPLDVLPIFVKAGGIIPMQDVVQYDNRQPWGTITFEIFPSGNTSFDLYEDDGLSEDYIDGNYSTTTISAQEWGDGLAFTEKAKGNFPVLTRYYVLKVYIDKAPAQVSRNGAKKKMKPSEPSSFTQAKSAAWYYDEDAKILWIKDMKASDEEVSYQVSY